MVVCMATLGDMVREARERKGLTQEDLEELAGVSQTHISQIETGKTKMPTIPMIERLAGVLELDTNAMKVLAGYPVVYLDAHNNVVPFPEIIKRRIAENSDNLTDDDWAEIDEMLERRHREGKR